VLLTINQSDFAWKTSKNQFVRKTLTSLAPVSLLFPCKEGARDDRVLVGIMAKLGANSEIIGNFRILKKILGYLVEHQKWNLHWNFECVGGLQKRFLPKKQSVTLDWAKNPSK